MVTFVTAYLNLQESRPADKTVERHFQLFQNFVDAGLPIHVYLSRCYMDMFQQHFGSHPTIRVEACDLEDLQTYKELEGLTLNLPAVRQHEHDTQNFMILMNAKVELMARTIDSNIYPSSHYAWIDFGLCHVFKSIQQSCQELRELTRSTLKIPLLAIPGAWEKGRNLRTLQSNVNWRFCGGFFVGDSKTLRTWNDTYRATFKPFIQQGGILLWETNVWTIQEQLGVLHPTWYLADHNDSMIQLPYTCFIEKSVALPPIRIHGDQPYWDGPYSRFHVGKDIETYCIDSIRKQKLPVSLILSRADGFLGSKEFARMRQANVRGVNNASEEEYAEWEARGKIGTYPVVGALCSRQFRRPNMLYLPLDDAVFRDGLASVLGPVQTDWASKQSGVVWRGGTSGFDVPSLRHKVVQALHGVPNTNVKFVRGGWPENDARIPTELFGERLTPVEQSASKAILVIDGSCIASNHMWVFGTGSVPVFVTHPHNQVWFQRYLKPMVNYVPIRYDLSDLQEKLQWLHEHDAEAQEIARSALELSRLVFSPAFQRTYIDEELRMIVGRRYNRIGFDTVYVRKCYTPGDINQHLPVLREYADRCESIVECGVLNSVSSYAFASALVKKPGNRYTLVDPYRNAGMDEFLEACKREGVNATFLHGSDLEVERVKADLVFIDTWHIYAQLKRELEYWHSYAGKYLILHDTTVDEWDGESVRGRFDIEKQARETGWPAEEIAKGLWPAVEEFLCEHPEWQLELRLVNNNGLTVLRRVA